MSAIILGLGLVRQTQDLDVSPNFNKVELASIFDGDTFRVIYPAKMTFVVRLSPFSYARVDYHKIKVAQLWPRQILSVVMRRKVYLLDISTLPIGRSLEVTNRLASHTLYDDYGVINPFSNLSFHLFCFLESCQRQIQDLLISWAHTRWVK